jgi:hypothetical protein
MGGNPGYINQLAGYSRDSFGRIVSATPTTIFTAHPAFTPQYERMGYASTGTGFISNITQSTMVILSVSGSGGRAVRQSLEYQLYQPGKGHLASFTFIPHLQGVFDNSVAIRAGVFDDYRDKNTPFGLTPPSSIYGGRGVETNQPSMGHFFELSGNQWFVVERHNSPNNIINVNRVPQRLWNMDTFNPALGPNPSGAILPADPKEGILLLVERQWLGVGIVRMGAYFNGVPKICHVFQERGIQNAYTHLNKLPIRFEIEKVSGGSPSTAITATICESSAIMGEYTPLGTLFSIPCNLTLPGAEVNLTLRPLLAIRLQRQYCRATFKLKDIELYSPDGDIAYSVFKNSTIVGPALTWIPNPDSRSMIEYVIFNANALNYTLIDGICFRSGFAGKNTVLQDSLGVPELLTAHSFCSDIAGVSDILLIAALAINAGGGTSFTVGANARWLEIV